LEETLRHQARTCEILMTLPDLEIAADFAEASILLDQAARLVEHARNRQHELWGKRR
jgi:hypothetical protein